jgi:hypothetical protein
MSIITSGTFQALGSVLAGGAAFISDESHPGFFGTSNGGVGLNDLALDAAADELQSIMLATPRSAVAGASCCTLHLSDTTKRVLTYAAGVLADTVAFDVAVFRLPNG